MSTPEELLAQILKANKKIAFGQTIGTNADGNCPVQTDDGSILARSPDQISAGSCVALKADDGQWYAVSARETGLVQRSVLYSRRNKPADEEFEELVPITAACSLYWFIYSGVGFSGLAFSDITLFAPFETSNLVYTFDNDTGELTEKTGELDHYIVSSPDPLNTIDTENSTPTQNFSGDNNQVGVQIAGSFISHPDSINPPKESGSLGYWEIYIRLSLSAQVFLQEWDIVGEDRPIKIIEDKIVELDGLLDLDKRAIVLTKLISDKAMEPLIVLVRDRITASRNPASFFGFISTTFGTDLDYALTKFLEPKLDAVPTVMPPILPTEEFASLSANMDLMKASLEAFLASTSFITESAATRATRKCTSAGERAAQLQTLITESNFTNYYAFDSLRAFSSPQRHFWYYGREWEDVLASPLDIELTIGDVPWSFSYGLNFNRIENDYYSLLVDGDMGDIPFGRSEYNMIWRWRKRGNTEWFSL